jgi:hypothetical protein
MPFPVDVDATWLNYPASNVEFDAGELRRADAGFLAGADGVAFGGIARHAETSLGVTVDGSDVVTVQPGTAIIQGDGGVGRGVYRASIASAQTGNLTARNSTNGRIDLLVFRALDTDVIGSHAAYKGRIELIAGTPAASPAVPAKPAMAVELARINVPNTGGGAATVDLTYRAYACAAGGELLVPTAGRLPSAGVTKWQRARTLDTGLGYTHDGAAWQANGLLQTAPTTDISDGTIKVVASIALQAGTWMLRGKGIVSWSGIATGIQGALFLADSANNVYDPSRHTYAIGTGMSAIGCEHYLTLASPATVRLIAQTTSATAAGTQAILNAVLSATRV